MIRLRMAVFLLSVCAALCLALPPFVGLLQAAEPVVQPPGQASAVDLPRVAAMLDFGVPAGNGPYPYQLAVDPVRGRVYTLNLGTNEIGNSVSVYDTRRQEIVALVPLNNPGHYNPPMPVELVVDPYRPHLYALTGDLYADAPAIDLFVIDVDRPAVTARLSGVEAVAPGPDSLFLANDTRLWAVDPNSLAEQRSQELPARKFNAPLVLNDRLNRLYLGRGNPAELAIFDATDLSELDIIPLKAQPDHIILHAPTGRLFVVETLDDRAQLTAFGADGQPLADPPPFEMTGEYLYRFPVAATEEVIYLGSGSYEDYRLRPYRLPDLRPMGDGFSIHLPNEIVADPATGLLYAQYTNFGGPLLTITPGAGVIRTTYTALKVRDALPDPAGGRLYVLDDAGTLHILASSGDERAGYSEQARVETGFSVFPLNWGDYGRMTLDPARRRLYIDGIPARSVDVDSLAVTEYPDVAGQLTPDPTSDRVYLTPPCRCRIEQCNTLILNAATMTGTQQLFPPADPMTAECVYETVLDESNRLLYVRIDNGIAGSNAGFYLGVFDVAGTPEMLQIVREISFGRLALDRAARRVYAPRYRMDRSFIHRFEMVDRTFAETWVLAGAGGSLAFDATTRRLYSVNQDSLQVFDEDLTLLADIPLLPSTTLLKTEVVDGRLYLAGTNGELVVVATSGGQLQPPQPPAPITAGSVPAQTLYAAPEGTLFRIFGERLYRSADGVNWELLGSGLPARPVCAFAISPDFARDNTLFAALMSYGRGGGLYRSTDGGRSWAPAMRGLTDTEICTLAISPTFGRDRTLFGASYTRGLFRSTDGGNSWTSLADRYATDSGPEVNDIALSPTYADDQLLIIARDTLWRSQDGGETWQDTHVPGGRLAFSPDFARDRLILSGATWRSTDGGLTWTPSAAGLAATAYGARSIMFSPRFATDQTVYVLLDHGYDRLSSLQRSVDAGRSWQTLRGGLPDGFTFNTMTLLPDGNMLFGAPNGRTVVVSPTQLLWSRPAPLTDAIMQLDIQDIAALPDGTLLIGHHAHGVLRSVDSGRSWFITDFPARGRSFDETRLAAASDGTVFAALGGAIERSTDGGQTWEHLGGVPVGFRAGALAVSPHYPNNGIVMAGGTYGNSYLIRSADRGTTWQVVFDASTVEGASDITAIAFSPRFAVDRLVYAWLQGGGLLGSADGGLTWELRATEHYDGQSLVVTPDGGRLILGALYGGILVSDDRGRTWVNAGDRIPVERVWSSDLLFDETGMLYLGTDRGIYRSADAGDRWSPASAGLPMDSSEGHPQGVRALAAAAGRLYAALWQGGVFVSADQGNTWRSTLTGEPASPIEAAAIPPSPTPAPSPTPLPPPPSPTPAGPTVPEDCAARPIFFANIWETRVALLGCPTGAQRVTVVDQSFERGWMFWRSDTRDIYALPDGAPYARFADLWDESQPEYTCPDSYPHQTPPTPKRGFGRVWCLPENGYLRDQLGYATSGERAFESEVQEFEHGLIFGTDRGVIYVLPFRTGAWEALR